MTVAASGTSGTPTLGLVPLLVLGSRCVSLAIRMRNTPQNEQCTRQCRVAGTTIAPATGPLVSSALPLPTLSIAPPPHASGPRCCSKMYLSPPWKHNLPPPSPPALPTYLRIYAKAMMSIACCGLGGSYSRDREGWGGRRYRIPVNRLRTRIAEADSCMRRECAVGRGRMITCGKEAGAGGVEVEDARGRMSLALSSVSLIGVLQGEEQAHSTSRLRGGRGWRRPWTG
ncbi:hypothetical protein FB45DRAFT_945816 [Roridomyces roridus]|uniref:Uncharacterized protein n=1 Tax=Roridomyces roridus TaxID=1738132 RepID=A0AAD7B2G3_9AGAR|nr:hypothetical protein FB45DRAFT_945816 [Roridomyces roridus]